MTQKAPTRHVPRPQIQPKPVEEQRVAPVAPAEETRPAPVQVAPSQEFPREMTFEEVCAHLDMNPRRRKLFANRQGQYVRSLIERYAWSIDEDRTVRAIPTWFIEGKDPHSGQMGPMFPGEDAGA